MGNRQPGSFAVNSDGVGAGDVAISTRSDPVGGYCVSKELGIVFGTSAPYSNRAETAHSAQRIAEAMTQMKDEAKRIGGQAVLGVHVEIKEYGQQYAIVQCYGTACQITMK